MQPRYVKQMIKFVFLFEITVFLAGCSSPVSEIRHWPQPLPTTLSLSNLPAIETRVQSAAISYKLNNGLGTERVHCRRDAYTPGPCPNPFVWAASDSLVTGPHKVDFYIDRGSGINEASPEVSYTWNIISGSPESPSTLSLSNLPAVDSKKTSVAIRYKLKNAASTEQVLCRVDNNAAGPCPNSFIFGKSTPLSVGTHQVDFYVDRGAGIDEASPEVSYTWDVTSGSATTRSELTLSNLPAIESEMTSAAIGYKLKNAAGTERVLCRVDNNAAEPCPKSFKLGNSAPLSVGTHKVDFYVDRGAGIDENSPDVTYSWNVISDRVAPLVRDTASADPLSVSMGQSMKH